MNEEKREFIKNIIYAFGAQGISLALSILMSLVVPKLLGIEEYSYWQLFLFYSGYVGFFLFGLNDGIYLRLGGCKYEGINHPLIGMQFRIAMLAQIIIAIISATFAINYITDPKRVFVLIGTCVYLCVFNATGFLGYLFQAVNRTRVYSISVMIDRLFFICVVVINLIFRINYFEFFVVFYVLSKVLALIYSVIVGRDIVFAKGCSFVNAIKETKLNISIGINLVLANIASMLILGISRLIIDKVWGITSFGKFSFALSMTNFFLLFISQASMVLFPALRQSDEEKQNLFYVHGRNTLGLFLPAIFLIYIPMKWLLGIWLPEYQESLRYLALLLPLCTFDGKMQLLCNTYFKVLRKEKLLLTINVVTTILSLVLSLLGAYVIGNIYAIVVFVVVSIAFRSIVSELILAKLMAVDIRINLFQEVFLVVLFMICSWFMPTLNAGIVFAIAYILYLLVNKNNLKQIFQLSKQVLKR